MEEIDQLPQVRLRTLGHHLHRPIGSIGYPSHKPQANRCPPGVFTKINALHQAGDGSFQTSR